MRKVVFRGQGLESYGKLASRWEWVLSAGTDCTLAFSVAKVALYSGGINLTPENYFYFKQLAVILIVMLFSEGFVSFFFV